MRSAAAVSGIVMLETVGLLTDVAVCRSDAAELALNAVEPVSDGGVLGWRARALVLASVYFWLWVNWAELVNWRRDGMPEGGFQVHASAVVKYPD